VALLCHKGDVKRVLSGVKHFFSRQNRLVIKIRQSRLVLTALDGLVAILSDMFEPNYLMWDWYNLDLASLIHDPCCSED